MSPLRVQLRTSNLCQACRKQDGKLMLRRILHPWREYAANSLVSGNACIERNVWAETRRMIAMPAPALSCMQ